MERLITSEELAQELNVSLRFVRRIVSERKIAYFKVGRSVRFNREGIEEYKRRNAFGPLSRAELMNSLAGV